MLRRMQWNWRVCFALQKSLFTRAALSNQQNKDSRRRGGVTAPIELTGPATSHWVHRAFSLRKCRSTVEMDGPRKHWQYRWKSDRCNTHKPWLTKLLKYVRVSSNPALKNKNKNVTPTSVYRPRFLVGSILLSRSSKQIKSSDKKWSTCVQDGI